MSAVRSSLLGSGVKAQLYVRPTRPQGRSSTVINPTAEIREKWAAAAVRLLMPRVEQKRECVRTSVGMRVRN